MSVRVPCSIGIVIISSWHGSTCTHRPKPYTNAPTVVFDRIAGFYLGYDDTPVGDVISSWSVKKLFVSTFMLRLYSCAFLCG